MIMTVTVRLKRHDEDEPNYVAAQALERLAAQLRDEAPHDFVTSGLETLDATVSSVWKAG